MFMDKYSIFRYRLHARATCATTGYMMIPEAWCIGSKGDIYVLSGACSLFCIDKYLGDDASMIKSSTMWLRCAYSSNARHIRNGALASIFTP